MTRKKHIAIVTALLLTVSGAYGLYWWGVMRGQHLAASSAVGESAVGGANKKILYWHDPMVPGSRFDKPGKSPFMDMPLVPVYADGAGAEEGVTISPRIQQNLGIRTAEVERGRLNPTIEAVGNVTYNEREVELVQARSNGYIEKLHVRAPLVTVRQGQILAELYVPDWVAVQEEYFAVKGLSGPGVDALLDGARQRMRLAGMTDAQIREVVSSGKVQPRLSVAAPIGGVVTELTAREGMTVASGAPLFRINGLRTVWINAEVPESHASRLHVSDGVEARVAAVGETVFRGRVQTVLPAIDPATRTITARVELANPEQRLVPGMFASLRIASAAGEEVLMVPSEAVIRTGRRDVVIIVEDDGRFAPVDVEIGAEIDGMTEIKSGVQAGRRVVVSGQFLLDSEANLRAGSLRMSESAAPAAAVVHHGAGKIERIGNDTIVISHGPIPSLHWGAMTMGFKPPAAGLPQNLSVGERVIFEIRSADGGLFEIVSIAPAQPAADIQSAPPRETHE